MYPAADPPGSTGIAPRYAAALACLELQAGDRVLEIGCGHGVLVGPMCHAVGPDGVVDALDRSSKMIAAAAARNADWVDSGRACLHTGRVQDVVFDDGVFDRVVAVRVRELWADAAATLPRISRWLRPGGRLCFVIDEPSGGRVADAVAAAVEAFHDHQFSEVTTQMSGSTIAAVHARR